MVSFLVGVFYAAVSVLLYIFYDYWPSVLHFLSRAEVAIPIFIFLNLIDWQSTIWLLRHGGSEVNNFPAFVLNRFGLSGFKVLKILIVATCIAIILQPTAHPAFVVALLFTFFLPGCWNCFLIFRIRWIKGN